MITPNEAKRLSRCIRAPLFINSTTGYRQDLPEEIWDRMSDSTKRLRSVVAKLPLYAHIMPTSDETDEVAAQLRAVYDHTYPTAVFAFWAALDDPRKIGFYTHERFEKAKDAVRQDLGIVDDPNTPFVQEEKALQPKYTRRFGTMTKPGKFFKRLFPFADPQEIEHLSHTWRLVNAPPDGRFEESNEVRHYYHEENYASSNGTLGSSCMRYEECQEYMDFYTEIGTRILVFLNEDDQIEGRALLWDNVRRETGGNLPDTFTFMDRVYYTSEQVKNAFFKYAAQKGYVRKEVQSFEHRMSFVLPDGRRAVGRISYQTPVDLRDAVTTAPFLDTLSFYDEVSDRLHNDSSARYDFACTYTDGEWFEGVEDYRTGERLRRTEALEGPEGWVAEDYAVPLEDGSGYVHMDDEDYVMLDPEYYDGAAHVRDAAQAEDGEWILHDDAVDVYLGQGTTGCFHRDYADDQGLIETFDGNMIFAEDAAYLPDTDAVHIDDYDGVLEAYFPEEYQAAMEKRARRAAEAATFPLFD